MQISQLVTTLATLLIQKKWRLVTAESCTGGGLAYHLTYESGSSAWFERGYVTYSNAAKESDLKVNAATLTTYGAVSEQTACAMAEGALRQSQAEIAVAITGIAGPSGGSIEKPVGTVWFGFATQQGQAYAYKKHFVGTREEIRKQAIQVALEQLVEILQK